MYRKFFVTLCALLAALPAVQAQAQERAADLVARLAASLAARGTYAVEFDVAAADFEATGYYAVSGDTFYLSMGDMELFSDGRERRTVDRRRREITVDPVAAGAASLLDDPVHAFDFAAEAYDASVVWERDGEALLRLVPRNEAEAFGTVLLRLEVEPLRLRSIVYGEGDDAVRIGIRDDASTKPLRRFSADEYSGYEFLDFR